MRTTEKKPTPKKKKVEMKDLETKKDPKGGMNNCTGCESMGCMSSGGGYKRK